MDTYALVLTVIVVGLANAALIYGLFRLLDRSKAKCPTCGGRGSGPHSYREGNPLFVCTSCRKVFEKATAAPPLASR